jgi:alkylhydroperoxidase/carboxymuconolactone decarboxylase family protein YurZ
MAGEPKVSNAFQVFLSQAPTESQAWMRMVKELDEASPLDEKIKALAYIAVLASLRMTSGIPFHVLAAKRAGASRQEVIGAILVGLPAAGHGVTKALPDALEAYGEQTR